MSSYSDWQKEYEAIVKATREELEALKQKHTEAELDKRFLKNFGCVNFMSEESTHELRLARMWHEDQRAAHPEKHQMREYEPHNCYHETRCTCGFATAVDSSD